MTYAAGDGSGSVLALTHNGGNQWARQPIYGTLTCDGGGTWDSRFDPGLAFSANGRLYLTESLQRTGPWTTGTNGVDTELLSVAPGGTALGRPTAVVVPNPLLGAQRGYILTNPAHPRRVIVLTERLAYLLGHYVPGPSELDLSVSNDAGATFVSHRIYGAPVGASVLAQGIVRTRGRLVVLAMQRSLSSTIAEDVGTGDSSTVALSLHSDDGGTTFGPPTTIETVASGDGLTGLALGSPAVGPTGEIVWAEPNPMQGLRLVESEDAGRSWSHVAVTSGRTWAEPMVTIRHDGAVCVTAYAVDTGADGSRTVQLHVFTANRLGGRWTERTIGAAFELDALGPVDDTSPLGPVQGTASLPHGFVIAATVGGKLVQTGGGSDVDLIVLGDR